MPLPFKLDSNLVEPAPFVFSDWLSGKKGRNFVFEKQHQMKVEVMHKGQYTVEPSSGDIWFYQIVSNLFNNKNLKVF